MTLKEIEDLRLAMLANGYTPTRNRDKRTFQVGWPHAVIDEAEIKRWTRRFSRDQATGVRIEDGLAALDIDIDDKAIVDRIANRILDICPELENPDVPLLVRHGKGAKEAWFVRTDETFSRIHSRAWTRPGEAVDAGAHRVEIFGGAVARQFGNFFWHTIPSDECPDGIRYAWAGPSPADTPKSELPVLTKAQFFAIVDAAEAELKAAGWSPVEKSQKGESDAVRVYDLTEDMQFDLNTGERVSLQRLRELAVEDGGELRCSASFLEGPTAVNTSRCIVGTSRAGNLTIWESASGVTHSEASAKPRDYTVEIDRIAERLKEIDEKRRNVVKPSDGAAVAATKLLATYAFCSNQQLGIVPLYATDTGEGMTMASFRTLMLPNCDEEIGPHGGVKKVNPVDIWSCSEKRVNVAGLRMRPDMPRPVYSDEGGQWVNTYTPPVHEGEAGDLGPFHVFMAHLLPDEAERSWFLDWMAHKYRRPWVPGPGVIMVSRRQGAGRGTLFALVKQLFGSRYVRKVDGATLTGEGGQSQYNTWLANTVMVLIDELFNAGTGAHLWQRKKAYDRIKGLIDPAAREVEIIQKNSNNYVTQTFTSFLMATNNLNALPLDEDDRRICVLTNGNIMAEDPDVALTVAGVRNGAAFSDAFVAAVAGFLMDRDIEAFDPFAVPPMFEGKANMILHNMTDVGEAADEALADLPGDYVTRNAFVERVKVRMGENAREQKHLSQEARDRLDRSRWVFLGRVKIKENGSKADVWARDKRAAATFTRMSLADRPAALEPNENPRGKASAVQMAALSKRLSVVKTGGQ